MPFAVAEDFESWRVEARRLLCAEIPPEDVFWNRSVEAAGLFGDEARAEFALERSVPISPTALVRVPPAFLEGAPLVAAHRSPDRWELLYRALWRLTHGESHLLELETDDDVIRMHRMTKSVTRDAHKMKAFVRFRRVVREGQEHFVAWHRPDHFVVPLTAPFFSRRFPEMHWSILTPDQSVAWNTQELTYGPGVPASEAPGADELEALWKTYYRSIFNPARLNPRTMKREMPVRYWKTMPESETIDALVNEAARRVDTMVTKTEGNRETAAAFLPDDPTLPKLAQAAAACTACQLYEPATQTVFGEGAKQSQIMLVGEQPGDQEDRVGRPFVGPAGELLDELLEEAGVSRDQTYVTNVVKHFKFVPRGKRRLHQKPGAREIAACRPWLESELEIVRPHTLVCLGATAAQALIGRDFRITKQRGEIRSTEWCERTLATWHPSAILRVPDSTRRAKMREDLIADLRRAGHA